MLYPALIVILLPREPSFEYSHFKAVSKILLLRDKPTFLQKQNNPREPLSQKGHSFGETTQMHL
jgi:hypothetical protein